MKKINKIGQIIKQKRTEHEISIEELAEKIGVSGAFLNGIESGKFKFPKKLLLPFLDLSWFETEKSRFEFIRAFVMQNKYLSKIKDIELLNSITSGHINDLKRTHQIGDMK